MSRYQFLEPETALAPRPNWKLAVGRLHNEGVKTGRLLEVVESGRCVARLEKETSVEGEAVLNGLEKSGLRQDQVILSRNFARDSISKERDARIIVRSLLCLDQ